MKSDRIKLVQHRFLVVYTIVLFLCFSPFKSFSLVSPFLALFLFIFYVKSRSWYNLTRITLFVFLYICLGLTYFFINEDFLWMNFFFFFITNSPFLFVIASFGDIVNKRLLVSFSSITIKVLFIEAVFGISQVLYNVCFCTHVFDGGTGDAAMGTINPTFGVGDGLGSNVYYAIALSALAVMVIAARFYEKRKIGLPTLLVLILGWIVASVMHSIFLLLTSTLMNIMIIIFFIPQGKLLFLNKQFKVIRATIGILSVVIICLFAFLPNNVNLLKMYYNNTFNSNQLKSTKSRATLITYNELGAEKPYQKYIGLGPGQYCSKASMILSGTYLSTKIPSFIKSTNHDLEKYILPIWLEYKSGRFKAGSTYFPFYSWLSVYGEFGFLGLGALILSLFFLCKRIINKINQENFILTLGLLVVIVYIFLLGVQDNYWEWAQFILPIVIFAKTVYYIILKPSGEI